MKKRDLHVLLRVVAIITGIAVLRAISHNIDYCRHYDFIGCGNSDDDAM
jgi:hypothetical protein